MDLDGSGDADFGGWSDDALKRYFTLQSLLPRDGGLFGSQWAQYMADQLDAANGSALFSYSDPLQQAAFPYSSTPAAPAGPPLSQSSWQPADKVEQSQSPAMAPFGPGPSDYSASHGNLSDGADGTSPVAYQIAAAAPRGPWDYWSPHGCANCHGYTPGTLPPYPGQSPIPPDFSLRRGGTSGGGDGGPGGGSSRNPPQCAVQYDNDSAICRRVGLRSCWESAARREAYCVNSKGEVGWPPLIAR